MHIPDGFLDFSVAGFTYIISIVYGGYTYLKIRDKIDSNIISLVSILSAVIFVAQMLNWPIPGGTSLHFVGGALAGIIMGPYIGFIIITIVLVIQCLVFHDGGITALGANILNMAIIDVLVGYGIYKLFIKMFKGSDWARFVGAFLGGWIGITLAGLTCGLEIGFSPLFPYGVLITVPIMTVWHLVLGILEGFITAFIVLYVTRKEPKLIYAG